MLVVVWTSNSNGLTLNLGMEPNELVLWSSTARACAAILAAYLWLTTRILGRVGLVRLGADVVDSSACVHWLAMRGLLSGFGLLLQVDLVLIGLKKHVTDSTVY